MENIIQVENLSHSFGSVQALKDISYSVRQGEVLGLLGPNGAGKTTSVRLLNGLFEASFGNIRVFGLNPDTDGDSIRKNTGVLTETPALYERLTARENLRFFGTLAGMNPGKIGSRSDELLKFFDLYQRADERVGVYSKGMKQRLALARVLLHNPDILFLDEPTSGLDPQAARQVHELITAVRDQNGQTVVLCSHNLLEAQRLCDRVAVMRKGKILALDDLDGLRNRYSPGLKVEIRLWKEVEELHEEDILSLRGVCSLENFDKKSLSLIVEEQAVIPILVDFLVRRGFQILSIQPDEITLEEIYFQLQESKEAQDE